MASLLRGFRYQVGYIATFARSLTFSGPRIDNSSLFAQPNHVCVCGSLMQNGMATAAAKSNDSLDRSLRRLDNDVRRIGRISRRDIEDILEEIKTSQSATSSQSLLVIRCCGNLVPEELPETRTNLVQEIWKTLNNLNVPMDISHYNALLRVYLENEHNFSPAEFLSELQSKGVEPNRVTYQRLVACYCQQGDIDGATGILEFMKEKGLPINEGVFNALILGHSQAGDMESAEGIVGMMKAAGLEPTNETFTTLLCGYAKDGNIEKINSILDTCDKQDIFLLDRDILEVVYSLATHGHEQYAEKILERIRKTVGYNQDAISVILRLVNKGQEDTALKILLTMPRGVRQDGDLIDTGGFFVKQLVKANRPFEKVVTLCNYLEENQLNPRATLIATEMAVTLGNIELTTALLKQVKALGFPIRHHYFWPLICAAKNQEQVLSVLRLMQEQFDLSPGGETIREYVIPSLREKNYDKLIALLRSAGLSVSSSVTSVVFNALEHNNLSEAARISNEYRVYYPPNLYRRQLVGAFNKTKDLDAYILFVRNIYENLSRLENLPSSQKAEVEDDNVAGDEADAAPSQNQAEMLGRIVYDAASYFKSNRAQVVHDILTGLVAQGLSITSAQATRIQDKLGAELTPEISEMLGKLSTGELEPVPLERPERTRGNIGEMNSATILNLINKLESKGENTKGLKRQLVGAYIKEKNVDKLEELVTKLQEEGYVLTSGVFAQIAEMYANDNNLEKALATLEKIKTKDPDFSLDRIKCVKIAQLFVNQDQIDDAIKFLESNQKTELTSEDMTVYNYNATVWRLLNSIADKGDVEGLNKIFDALVKFKYCEATNVLLGPKIKVHLVKDNLEEAINAFEEICQKYRVTPWKNELACRLIQKEDATNLQRLTDLATDIHGEVNSLYDLVFSFVECGRIRQARKILETPGLRTRPQRINSACERYREEGMTQPLEALVDATRDLAHIDRMKIYYNLLLSYIKDKQPEKALGLWTKLQEESIAPSDPFLIKLADFLKENNITVPFVVPEPTLRVRDRPVQDTIQKISPERVANNQRTRTTRSSVVNANVSPNIQALRTAVKQNDIDTALNTYKALTSTDKPTNIDLANLIEILLRADRINESKKIVDDMIKNGNFPLSRVFRFFLNRIASSGDTVYLDQLEPKLDEEQKRILSFDNRYCHAVLNSGKVDEYLAKLHETITNANDEAEINAAATKFPRGGAFGILENMPDKIEKFLQMAEKYAEKKVMAPINVAWAHFFVTGNHEVAEEIWKKYLANEPRIMFQHIAQTARETQNPELAQQLVQKLKESKVAENAVGIAYSCLIDVLVVKERFDDSLNVVKEASSTVGLEYVNRTALQRVKDGVEKSGKTFEFTIPPKTKQRANEPDTTSSSSGSSSDDEVEKKQKQTL